MKKSVLAILILAGIPVILFGGSIIAGAVFTTTVSDGTDCLQRSSGFSDSPVMVGNFGASDGNLLIELRSASSSSVEVQSISVDNNTKEVQETMTVGSTRTYTLEGYSEGDCTTADLEITVASDGETEDVTGTITGEFAAN
jgi:hypothetical protein